MTDQTPKSNDPDTDQAAAPVTTPATSAAQPPAAPDHQPVEEVIEVHTPPTLPPARGLDELFDKLDQLEERINQGFAQATPAPAPVVEPVQPVQSVESVQPEPITESEDKPHAKKTKASSGTGSRKIKLFRSKRK